MISTNPPFAMNPQPNNITPASSETIRKKWYVAFVKSCQEKRVAAQLEAFGEEYFLPVQRVARRWSDRVKEVDVLVLKGLIFVHTSEKRRMELIKEIYGIYAYMNASGAYHPVVIPNKQMSTFMYMLGQSELPVTMVAEPLQPGDKVRVLRGSLAGLEGEFIENGNHHQVFVRLDILGAASVEISPANLEKINP